MIPNKADAKECVYNDGWSLCMELRGTAGSFEEWNVEFNNNHTTEYFRILCDDDNKSVAEWSSRGGLTQEEADYVAEMFCSL